MCESHRWEKQVICHVSFLWILKIETGAGSRAHCTKMPFSFRETYLGKHERCEALCILTKSFHLNYERLRPYNFFKHQDGTVMLFYSKACITIVRIHMHIFHIVPRYLVNQSDPLVTLLSFGLVSEA